MAGFRSGEGLSRWLGALALLVAVGGCAEQDPDHISVQSVTGKVLVDGQPAGRVQITFHPVRLADPSGQLAGPGRVRPFAVSQPDGSYAPSTYRSGDGLPPGEYALTVVWPKLLEEDGEQVEGGDLLKNRYNKVDHPAQTITIEEGAAEIPPLDLKTR